MLLSKNCDFQYFDNQLFENLIFSNFTKKILLGMDSILDFKDKLFLNIFHYFIIPFTLDYNNHSYSAL